MTDFSSFIENQGCFRQNKTEESTHLKFLLHRIGLLRIKSKLINEIRDLSIEELGHIPPKPEKENAFDNCRSNILASNVRAM